MINRPSIRTTFCLAVLLAGSFLRAGAAEAGSDLTAAANKFLATLNDGQKAKAVHDFKAEARHQWHFIPTEMVSFGRKGVPFTELKQEQRDLALALLRTSLSDPGYKKASTIMSLESVLRDIEKNGRVDRNPILYFVSIYGKPAAKGAWAWRFEGHHLSLNFTVVDGQIAATPSFMGSNPANVLEGPAKGTRALGKEEDMARDLVKSLNAAQRKSAIYEDKAPKDIITAADRDVKASDSRLEPKGVAFSTLDRGQQGKLRALVGEYVGRVRADVAKTDLAEIEKTGWDKVHFAWAGGVEPGEGHYYRVQGPTFLLEYDNTQNNANHVHAVWRDFNGDWGADLLKEHYAQDHK